MVGGRSRTLQRDGGRTSGRAGSARQDSGVLADPGRSGGPTGAGPDRVRLDSLTSLRFFAALFVVVHHVTRVYDPLPIVSDVFELGGVGVSFFFVLSGFVLTWSHREGASAGRFYRNRFARIYPVHVVTLALALAVLLAQGQARSVEVVVASVLLLQAWVPAASFLVGVNGPSWSLSSEAFFYAVFPPARRLLAPLRRRGLLLCAVTAVAGAAGVAIALRLVIGGDTVNYFLYMDPAYRLWEFLLGVVTASAFRRGLFAPLRLRGAALLAVGAYLLTASIDYAVTHRLGVLTSVPFESFPSDLAAIPLAPVFAVLIGAAARSDLEGTSSRLRAPMLVRLGTWSFALYLTHLLLISVAQPFMPLRPPVLVAIGIAVATIVAAIALAGATYHLVERPFERLIRGSVRVSGDADPAAPRRVRAPSAPSS